jgi:hypothetical protein
MMWERGMCGIALGHRPVIAHQHLEYLKRMRASWPKRDIATQPRSIESVASSSNEAPPTKKTKPDHTATRSGATPAEKDHADFQKALNIWLDLVREFGDSCGIHRKSGPFPGELESSVLAAIWGKPASTLRKRSTSLRFFADWAATFGVAPWPPKEAHVFSYLEHLDSTSAPASRAQAFREALGFAHGFFELDDATAAVSSSRVVGLARKSLSKKAPVRQREVLTVEMVKCLERFVASDNDEVERTVAGTALFCLHARARVGDVLRATDEPSLDLTEIEGATDGFIQLDLLHHKTASRHATRRKLPLVASAVGASGINWASPWMFARASQRRRAPDMGCFLTPPLIGGGWSDTRMTTTQLGLWVQSFLRDNFPFVMSTKFGSHSLKATLLSWCAKYGTDPELRRLLGGHTKGSDSSRLAYSRDEIAGPMRALAVVLLKVREGSFDPDSTRSGRFITIASPSSSSSSSSGSSSSSSADEATQVPLGALYVLNVSTKIIHIEGEGEDAGLLCGKPFPLISHTFPEFPGEGNFKYCKLCTKVPL